MKKFYKFATAFLALIMLLPFGTIHAAAYDDCDVNHDGFVDVSDAVATARYLAGNHYISNYNRFDTNKSLTVDTTDVDKILAKIAMLSYSAAYWSKTNSSTISFPTIFGFTPDANASSTNSRTYRRYSYSSHQEMNTYSLTPTAASFNSSTPSQIPRAIIGTDGRYPSSSAENTGIVRLEGDIYGTGFIVGDNVIATAAHCVYDRNDDGMGTEGFYNTPTIYTYNANGTKSSVTLNPTEVHLPDDYITASDNDQWEYDYALIVVSNDLSNYMHFSLGTTYNLNQTNFANIPIYLLGPGMNYNGINTTNLYYSQGNIYTDSTTTLNNMMFYDCDSKAGQSGSPIYTITKTIIGGNTSYQYTAVAIHTRNDTGFNTIPTWNAGVRITKYQLQFFDYDTNTYIPRLT